MPLKLVNWSDSPCFYVSVSDHEKERTALLAGPFITHQSALAAKPAVAQLAADLDPRGHFYSYGTCRRENGYPTGSMNSRFEEAHPEINRGMWN